MAIQFAGQVGHELFRAPKPFFLSQSGIASVGTTGFTSQIGQGSDFGNSSTQSGSSFAATSGDVDCGPYGGPFADGRFDSLSGCADLTGNFADGRFQQATDQPVILPPTDPGPFSIYKGPTFEGVNNIAKDFYTYDALALEQMKRAGVRIVVYKLDREHTEVDTLLGEARGNEYYKKGIVVNGTVELNPIIMELAKWGVDENMELNVRFNLTQLYQRLGRPVLVGDIVAIYLTSSRLTQAVLNQDQHNRDWEARHTRILTKATTSIPDRLFLFNYLELMANVAKIRFDDEVIDDLEDVYELDEQPPTGEDLPNFPFRPV